MKENKTFFKILKHTMFLLSVVLFSCLCVCVCVCVCVCFFFNLKLRLSFEKRSARNVCSLKVNKLVFQSFLISFLFVFFFFSFYYFPP
jgi:hypothetical protein